MKILHEIVPFAFCKGNVNLQTPNPCYFTQDCLTAKNSKLFRYACAEIHFAEYMLHFLNHIFIHCKVKRMILHKISPFLSNSLMGYAGQLSFAGTFSNTARFICPGSFKSSGQTAHDVLSCQLSGMTATSCSSVNLTSMYISLLSQSINESGCTKQTSYIS